MDKAVAVTPTTAPAVTPVETPAAPQREKTGIEREAELLTPIPYQPGTSLYKQILPGIIQIPADTVVAMSRKSSLWPMTFGLACCAIEMIATYM